MILGSSLLCVAAFAGSDEARKCDLPQIKTQMVAHLTNTPEVPGARARQKREKSGSRSSPSSSTRPPGNAAPYAETLKPDGTWSDIDYTDQTPGHWMPAAHLGRVLEMARSYATQGNPMHGNPSLRKAIHSALGDWLAKDYRSVNWWHNEIGVPRNLGFIMLLIGHELSPKEKADGLKIIARAEIGKTGQNRIWLAENTLMRGLLENDAALVKSARDALLGEIIVTTNEGVQPDNSFHQHGPQLQFGNYGGSFASDTTAWAEVLRGTALAFDESKITLVRNYLLEGMCSICWQGRMDISSCARQLFPGSPASKCRSYLQALHMMQRADPDHSTQYQVAIDSSSTGANGKTFVANKHFWRSDYMVDRRAGYYASVRMSSRRVIGSELTNSENLQGLHLGDGAFYIYQNGREYEEIFPVWDWHKLPGTTVAQGKTDLSPSQTRIDSDFVGGVSDGHNGAAVLDYKRNGVTAKKSWFFL